jgi:hypothetical protein
MAAGRPTTWAALERGGDDEALTFTASSEAVNRYGFRLRNSGWKLDNFNLNPVILYQHMDHVPPIGRGRAFRRDSKLAIQITFDREDPFAAAIERKYRAGIMHAVSVGFDFVDSRGAPLKQWWSLTAEQIEKDAYYDLAETSTVAVPADPQAVRQQHAALSTAGMELLDLAGWQRGDGGMLTPPAGEGGQFGTPVAPVLPGNGDADRRLADLEERFARVLSSLAVIPAHSSAVTDESWTALDLTAGDPAALRALHAWTDPDGDPSSPDSYRFAHHASPGGPANVPACREALEHLDEVPDTDRAGVERHLRRHLDEYDQQQGNGTAGTYSPDAAQDFLAAIRL